MVATIMLLGSWLVLSRLNAETGGAKAVARDRNAAVLKRAKLALIGYVATQAARSSELNPGSLPCPEDPANYASGSNQGVSATNCATVTAGRLPWRTLGMDKVVDASGEPLWYVVSSNWGASAAANGYAINSNTLGQLTVDGTANAAVALIFAPGPAFSVPAAAGCAAKNQVRPTTGTPDITNYLECDNATPADSSFVTTGPSTSFNDQVIKVTVADLMPGIEAGVAARIGKEIVPAFNSVYASSSGWGITGGNPLYPFAATFANPGPGAGTSTYQGVLNTYRGLLPFNQTNCTVTAANPRCTTSFLARSKAGNDTSTGSGSIRTQSACSLSGNTYTCTGEYNQPSIAVTVRLNVTNVAMGLRTLAATCTAVDDVGSGISQQTVPCSVSGALQSNGSASITVVTSTLPDVAASGWGTYANYSVSVVVGDHALLDSNDATTGWFVRNEWYRLLYYATVQPMTAAALPTMPGCTAGSNCLTVANFTPAPINNKRALLILTGRSINGRARPGTPFSLSDYLEFGNASASFEKLPAVSPAANVYTDTGSANAYSVPATVVTQGRPFQFRAANANTGTSTLSTTATGSKSLVNIDGSNLVAGQVPQYGLVEVTYDGTRFRLSRSPSNDRIVVVGES